MPIGHHKTAGVNTKTGTPWKKVNSWFGYGLHLSADNRYEIPVALHLTTASLKYVYPGKNPD